MFTVSVDNMETFARVVKFLSLTFSLESLNLTCTAPTNDGIYFT